MATSTLSSPHAAVPATGAQAGPAQSGPTRSAPPHSGPYGGTPFSRPADLADVDIPELFRRAAEADGAERRFLLDEIVERHLPLADALARRYSRSRTDPEDLRQVARVGLIE